MYHAVLPLDTTEPIATGIHKYGPDVKALIERRAPCVIDKTAMMAHSHLIAGNTLVATMNSPRVGKTVGTIVIKWSFRGRSSADACWTGNIQVRLAMPGGSPLPEATRDRVSKGAASTPETEIDADILALNRAVSMLMREASLLPQSVLQRPSARILSDNSLLLPELFRQVIRRNLDEHKKAVSEENVERARIVARINNLPDGTPLVLRAGVHGRSWQLGIKRGTITAAKALNTAIATPEILRSDEIRAAGLSMHRLLALEHAANIALEADPQSALFPTGLPILAQSYCKLHDSKPFDDSFFDPKAIKARRTGPRIWMQGSFTETSYQFSSTSPENHPGKAPPAGGGLNTRYGPSFPRHPQCQARQVSRITNTVTGPAKQPVPDDFSFIGNLWCLSAKAAEVLRAHDIGGAELRPLAVYQDSNTRLPGQWYHLILGDPTQAVQLGNMSESLRRDLTCRTILPYEIEIDCAATQARDLWWDDRLPRSALFMSGKLKAALTKAGISLKIGLKPCQPT